MCAVVAHDNLKNFALSLASSALLLSILLSIRNRILRMTLVDVFFIIAAASFFVREVYTSISKDMILATVGVSWQVSLSMVQIIPIYYVLGFGAFVLVVSTLSYHAYISIAGRLKFYVLPIPLIVSLLEPVRADLEDWGYHWFLNNNMYSATFMAQDYLDSYKIFWGDAVAAGMISIEAYADRLKYAQVVHNKMPDYMSRESAGADKVIFVIGEASNVKRYSAFGYQTPTTPNLDQMAKSGDICLVDKVHSSTPTTRTSVPMYVSFATPEAPENLFTYKNIMELAQGNGYKTYWIGSQRLTTLWDKTYYFVAKYADIIDTPSHKNTNYEIRESKDDDLIPPVKGLFSSAPQKAFFVIHLSGNHLSYKFKHDETDTKALPNADEYDRSIYHVDRILKQIKDEADKNFGSSYQLVYLPDHGEAVNYGHGFATHLNEMYLIPLLSNNRSNCDAMERLRGPDGYVSGETVKYLMMHLLGYKTDERFLAQVRDNSYKILNGYEQIEDFRTLDPCTTESCPD
jgi:glucan phosphoethanolaminetransferase (alkaline phosphatase superfamily)